jgi:hypothetical protein
MQNRKLCSIIFKNNCGNFTNKSIRYNNKYLRIFIFFNKSRLLTVIHSVILPNLIFLSYTLHYRVEMPFFYFAFVLMLLRYCFAYRNRKRRDTKNSNFLILTDTVVSRQTADVTLGGILQL